MAIDMEKVVPGVFLAIIIVINVAGNSLVIHVIKTQHGPKTSTNYLLLNLAIADMIFGVFLIPEIVISSGFVEHPKGLLGDVFCKVLTNNSISWLAGEAALFTMVTLTFERYFAVCHPHSFRRRFSPRKVKRIVVCSWIFAMVVMMPIFISSYWDPNNSNCGLKPPLDQIHAVRVATECALSVTVMIVFSVKISVSLWCKHTVIQPTALRELEERKKKKKATLCVLAVVLTYLLCYFPSFIAYITSSFVSVANAEILLEIMPTILIVINSALDPFLYSFQSSRFRMYLKKIICCK